MTKRPNITRLREVEATELYRVEEAAAVLDVCVRTVLRRVKAGELAAAPRARRQGSLVKILGRDLLAAAGLAIAAAAPRRCPETEAARAARVEADRAEMRRYVRECGRP